MPTPLVTPREMAEIDRRAIEEFGVPGVCLMENAGVCVVRAMGERYGRMGGRRVGVLAGKGNNGGDAFVVARHLHNQGARVEIYCLFDPEGTEGDARVHLHAARKVGIPLRAVTGEAALREVEDDWKGVELWVDGVFGTGLASTPRGHVAAALSRLSASGAPVTAIDIPSGLCAETGRPLGVAVRADLTVTFALPKRGHVLYPGPEWTGKLVVADIGVPRAAVEAQGVRTFLLESGDVSPLFPPVPADAYKGTFGHVLVVAGSTGKMGAAFLAAGGALRSGAGLVTLAHPEGAAALAAAPPEMMTLPLPSTPSGSFSEDALGRGLEAAARVDAVVLGPGVSTNEEAAAFVRQWVLRCPKPLVVDADGLNALAEGFEGWSRASAPLCLTPHPGEMARLLGGAARETQADRIETARAFARGRGVHLALKGAGTVLAFPEGDVWVNTTGNPGLATGGTGDILAGVVGSLLAQGLCARDALAAGVYLHGLAGDLTAEEVGGRGMSASDVMARLPAARRLLTGGRKSAPPAGERA
ncbi:MAG: NAD(P)H-hydrate dehydratase [Candidatus Tectomicrobia bacterium]|nr:NAD(P)H-hydrate dehydratase [Candidatus Tectomicrobia bacterium]